MTHLVFCEPKLLSVVRSGACDCIQTHGNWVAIGREVVCFTLAANAGIKCPHSAAQN